MLSRNPTPRFYSDEMKDYVHTKICTQMFLVTLFIITQVSLNRGMDERWCIHTREDNQATKRNKLLITHWREQISKALCSVIRPDSKGCESNLIYAIYVTFCKRLTTGTKSRSVSIRLGVGRRGWGQRTQGYLGEWQNSSISWLWWWLRSQRTLHWKLHMFNCMWYISSKKPTKTIKYRKTYPTFSTTGSCSKSD